MPVSVVLRAITDSHISNQPITMANPVVAPGRKRVHVEFKDKGGKTYSLKMADSNTKGTLFALMGYTDKGDKVSDGATILTRDGALDNGLVVPMIADCKQGSRTTTKKVYIPVTKLEETIQGAAGKTIGALNVIKIRGIRVRVTQ
jgi:hypothetical protein